MTEKETYSLREAYGKALVELGCTNPAIVALDADLGKSTFARMMGDLDENRYVEMGIAEQNMAAVSAGLAIAGKIPFFSSFAVFSTGRAYDQIRSSVCIPGFNVNICGSSAGLSDYGDGKTHQSIDDIALMRVLPRMAVLAPMDANQVYGMVEAMVEYDGPSYIRIPRNPLPALSERRPYEIGQLDLLRSGEDVLLCACGGSVHTALEAADVLKDHGIRAGVVSVGTIKPFPRENLRRLVAETPRITVIEEHNRIGGLGSAVNAALAGLSYSFDHLAMDDEFGQSASSYEELLDCYGLDTKSLVARLEKTLNNDKKKVCV